MKLIIISVDQPECDSLDSTWRKVVTEPGLPVLHGAEITLNCEADFTNKGGDKAACGDGGIVVLTGTLVPDCRGKSWCVMCERNN